MQHRAAVESNRADGRSTSAALEGSTMDLCSGQRVPHPVCTALASGRTIVPGAGRAPQPRPEMRDVLESISLLKPFKGCSRSLAVEFDKV